MTDNQTPPDWVLIEAAKRSNWRDTDLEWIKESSEYLNPMYRALCDMIAKHEQPPVDRKLLCAREAAVGEGWDPDGSCKDACIRAIELWESGYGA